MAAMQGAHGRYQGDAFAGFPEWHKAEAER
jgi:hypothetical protein